MMIEMILIDLLRNISRIQETQKLSIKSSWILLEWLDWVRALKQWKVILKEISSRKVLLSDKEDKTRLLEIFDISKENKTKLNKEHKGEIWIELGF